MSGMLKPCSNACSVAIAVLFACACGVYAPPAHAQSRFLDLFRPQPETLDVVSPLADAEDDQATGAPLTIRPSDEAVRSVPALTYAPLPPRRPSALPPIVAGGPAATIVGPAPVVEAPVVEFEPVNPDRPGQIAALSTPTLPRGVAPIISTPAEVDAEEERTPEPMLVEKQTDYVNISCLKPELMAVIRKAGEHFKGTPVITSGQRERGRRGSYHRRCMAADFFVPGVDRQALARYLRAAPGAGGVGTYCHTKSVHIDIGEPRNWVQCGMRVRFALRQ